MAGGDGEASLEARYFFPPGPVFAVEMRVRLPPRPDTSSPEARYAANDDLEARDVSPEASEAWLGKLARAAMSNDKRLSGRVETVNLYGLTFQPADHVLENTEGVVGFFGASSMERLPTEVAMTENMKRFERIGGQATSAWSGSALSIVGAGGASGLHQTSIKPPSPIRNDRASRATAARRGRCSWASPPGAALPGPPDPPAPPA